MTCFSIPWTILPISSRKGWIPRQGAVAQAEAIIDSNVVNFMHWLESRELVPTIRALRDQAERYRRHEMERATKLLAKGEDPQKISNP